MRTMRGKELVFFAAIQALMVCMVSCSRDPQSGRVVFNPAQLFSTVESQRGRSRVMEDFTSDPASASIKYRNEWRQHSSRNRSNDDKITTVRMLAIAGQLIGRDAQNYDEYYRYILDYLNSPDPEIESDAIGALSDAKGPESINLLFSRVSGRNEEAVWASAIVLDYRYQTSEGNPPLMEDAALIAKKARILCAGKPRNTQVVRFCEKNRF